MDRLGMRTDSCSLISMPNLALMVPFRSLSKKGAC